MSAVPIEIETIKFVADLISDSAKVPENLLFPLAKKMIEKDKVGDDDWLRNQVHLHQNDVIFTQFKNIEIKIFKRAFGENSMSFLKKVLKDPEKISPRWASHFMETVSKIGVERVLQETNIHRFVTTHELWNKCKCARKLFYSKKDRAEFIQQRKVSNQ